MWEQPEIRRGVEARREQWREKLGVDDDLVRGDFYPVSREEVGVLGFEASDVSEIVAEMNAQREAQNRGLDRVIGAMDFGSGTGDDDLDPGVAEIMRRFQAAQAAGQK
jgi:hypothetical protein